MIWLAIVVIGLSILCSALHLKGKNRRCTTETTGRLARILVSSRDRGGVDVRKKRYVYSYSVDGRDYKVLTNEGDNNPEAKEIGDACTIWYNPKKPSEARAYRFESNRPLNIMIVVGIVVTLVGFLSEFWWLILL